MKLKQRKELKLQGGSCLFLYLFLWKALTSLGSHGNSSLSSLISVMCNSFTAALLCGHRPWNTAQRHTSHTHQCLTLPCITLTQPRQFHNMLACKQKCFTLKCQSCFNKVMISAQFRIYIKCTEIIYATTNKCFLFSCINCTCTT